MNFSRLTSRYVLADGYLRDGQIQKVIEVLEPVVNKKDDILDQDDQSRRASQYLLAEAYQDGQIKKAIELLEHVINIESGILDQNDPFRLASQHALAKAYKEDGQIKKAIELLEHVVNIKNDILDQDDSSRLDAAYLMKITPLYGHTCTPWRGYLKYTTKCKGKRWILEKARAKCRVALYPNDSLTDRKENR
ncbi:hypothetical protein BDV29DRAFT_153198 [Aspergillus leporis]|uniref:MalT-like TPR region domain-containing protein n=1 Tax=Aspergillus leporis TaxID=41062 RepID=A0A5N5XAZ9_9EURO|nr:hypothetical protein BDV29DRAFT_153198 [Aspergillus leporis]